MYLIHKRTKNRKQQKNSGKKCKEIKKTKK